MDAKELLQKIAELKAKAADINSELREAKEALREAIKDGGTTGDVLKDYVIVSFDGLEKAEDFFRNLQARLVGKFGQFILVVVKGRETRPPDVKGFGNENVEYYLGQIFGESLLLTDSDQCLFPVFRRAYLGPSGEVKILDKALDTVFCGMSIYSLCQSDRYSPSSLLQINICIGNDEIEEWFKPNSHSTDILINLFRALGEEIPESLSLHKILEDKKKKIVEILRKIKEERDDMAGRLPHQVEMFNGQVEYWIKAGVELGIPESELSQYRT